MPHDDMNTSGEEQSAFTVPAFETFTLRLILAQLRHDLDHLEIVLREIRNSGPGLLWAVAAALSTFAAKGLSASWGGDRQVAARKATRACREGVQLGGAGTSQGAWRLVIAQLTDPAAVGDVLGELENQGGLDIVERVVIFLNGMVAQSVVQQCGGNRKAAARTVEVQLAESLSRPTA